MCVQSVVVPELQKREVREPSRRCRSVAMRCLVAEQGAIEALNEVYAQGSEVVEGVRYQDWASGVFGYQTKPPPPNFKARESCKR